jgi:hypothetical protein
METTLNASRRWWLLLPIIIAIALPLWETQLRYGWPEMALGGFAWLFWIAVTAWVVLTAAAIRRHRAWWLLVTTPFVLYPVVMAVGLLAACAGGDCL